jgi:hypothetical protein
MLTKDSLDKQGYNEFFFCPPALGDNLCLFFAAEKYFEYNGKKILIGTTFPEFVADANYCDVYGNTSMSNLSGILRELAHHNIKSYFINYMVTQKKSNSPFTDYYFPDNHILAEMCSRIGLLISPTFLPQIEKYDAILTIRVHEWMNGYTSINEQYVAHHTVQMYLNAIEVISNLYPLEVEHFKEFFFGKNFYAFELYILRKEIFLEFCEWIFPILLL